MNLTLDRLVFDMHALEKYEAGNPNPFFIAHLFEKVIVGRKWEDESNVDQDDKRTCAYKELTKGIEKNKVLELHLFGCGTELFVDREDGALKQYPLIMSPSLEEKMDEPKFAPIIREYAIEKSLKTNYDILVIEEHVAFDPDSGLAYVKKTMLKEMKRRGEK